MKLCNSPIFYNPIIAGCELICLIQNSKTSFEALHLIPRLSKFVVK